MFDDFDDQTTKAKRRERIRFGKRKKPGQTASDRQKRAAEIREIRKMRMEEARERIKGELQKRHLSTESQPETERLQHYIRWVENSLAQGFPLLTEDDLEFKATTASVKAGGQHLQRKRTAARVTHLPTSFSVRNEEERSFERNKGRAREVIYRNLEGHLRLWQTMVKNSALPIDIAKTTLALLEKRSGKGTNAG